jgi:hypothetical protein
MSTVQFFLLLAFIFIAPHLSDVRARGFHIASMVCAGGFFGWQVFA